MCYFNSFRSDNPVDNFESSSAENINVKTQFSMAETESAFFIFFILD